MNWSDRYIGIPYADLGRSLHGCDCWGLACIVYRYELGIILPDYLGTYGSAEEHAEIDALIAGEETSPLWRSVARPEPFDIAVFRRGRLATHVGIIVQPGLMLHMHDDDCAKLADYRGGAWGNRLKGIYRHRSRGA